MELEDTTVDQKKESYLINLYIKNYKLQNGLYVKSIKNMFYVIK